MKKNIQTHIINQYQEQYPGYVLYKGPSAINGEQILAILTTKSSNTKTGNIAQITYIPVDGYGDKHPLKKIRTEVKKAVCGSCPLLGGGCYVTPMGTASIKRAYFAGNYKDISDDIQAIQALLSKYIVRNGQDGDPLSIPFNLVNTISQFSMLHLSYSHIWKDNPEQAGNHMASVENIKDAIQAQEMGFKTFRVRENEDSPLTENEVLCPYENDKSKQCQVCQLCTGDKCNIVVTAHGSGAKKIKFYK